MAQDRNILNILPRLVSKGLFNDSVSAMDVFDLDYFENRIQELQSAFFEDFITHTLAIKANPIKGSDGSGNRFWILGKFFSNFKYAPF